MKPCERPPTDFLHVMAPENKHLSLSLIKLVIIRGLERLYSDHRSFVHFHLQYLLAIQHRTRLCGLFLCVYVCTLVVKRVNCLVSCIVAMCNGRPCFNNDGV